MGMGVNGSKHGLVGNVLLHQFQGIPGCLDSGEYVDNDESVFSFDEGCIGLGFAPNLVHTVSYPEEPPDIVQLGVPPKAGVRCVWRLVA